MQITAAPPGEIRDALCTVDGMPPGKSAGVVMSSRTDTNVAGGRAFVATVAQADAASCTGRQLPT